MGDRESHRTGGHDHLPRAGGAQRKGAGYRCAKARGALAQDCQGSRPTVPPTAPAGNPAYLGYSGGNPAGGGTPLLSRRGGGLSLIAESGWSRDGSKTGRNRRGFRGTGGRMDGSGALATAGRQMGSSLAWTADLASRNGGSGRHGRFVSSLGCGLIE